MTRAEATARVVAAARRVVEPDAFDTTRWIAEGYLRDALRALDACPQEDTVDVLGIVMPLALYEARLAVWEAGLALEAERFRESAKGWRPAWVLAYPHASGPDSAPHNGWWPTRDAEHAAHAGTYWIDTQRGGGPTARHAQDRGAMTPAPSGPEVVAGGEYGGPPWRVELSRVENDAFHRAKGLDDRLSRLETAVMGHECAGPAELIDSARLDALAAQVGRVEQVITILSDPPYPCERHVRAKRILDGGPDATA